MTEQAVQLLYWSRKFVSLKRNARRRKKNLMHKHSSTLMALDLSNVNENSFEVSDSSISSECILLPADFIILPGKNAIPFHVSESGHLILANFTVDLKNGVPALKKRLPVSTFDSRNVSANMPSDIGNFNTDEHRLWLIANPSGFSKYWPRSITRPVDSDGSGSVDPPFESSFYSTSPLVPKTIQSDASQLSEFRPLSLSEEPVDATMHRRSSSSVEVGLTKQSTSDPDKIASFLRQSVCEILEHHGFPWNETETRDDLIINGHNMSQLVRFVQQLKRYRLRVGLTQSQLSHELVVYFNNGSAFSQVLLSRFERLEVTVRSAFRLLPYLKSWLDQKVSKTCSTDEEDHADFYREHVDRPFGSKMKVLGKSRTKKLLRFGLSVDRLTEQSLADDNRQKPPKIIGASDHHSRSPVRTDVDLDSRQVAQPANSNFPFERKKRTHFSESVIRILADAYKRNPRPKGVHLTRLAMKTGCHRESIRFWFCNRRQADARLMEQSGV